MENTNALDMLERDPDRVSGAWVFKGTRVPVSALFENLKDGASIDQFLEWFPGVTRDQVEAAKMRYELEKKLDQYEKQYGWSSQDFYAQFLTGGLGDGEDYLEWAGFYEMLQFTDDVTT